MRLALFDLDDTLLDGDCSDRWNLWMIEQGWISDPMSLWRVRRRCTRPITRVS
jgi:phosphoserine phosphatase